MKKMLFSLLIALLVCACDPLITDPKNPCAGTDSVSTGQPLPQTAIRPALELNDGQPAETWLVPATGEGLAAAAALTLRHHLAAADPSRLGICEGRRCADAYIDTSPAARRRFCSVTCQNRARVAAWRRRRS